MKNLKAILSGTILLTSFTWLFIQDLYAECPPPELEQFFERKESLGEFMVYTIPEVEQNYLEHIKYLYNRFLYRDDKSGGKIRQAIADAKLAAILMEDGDDLEEFTKTYKGLLKKCPVQEFLIEEIIPLGTEADKLGVRDATIEEIINLIYYWGIKEVYPSWTKKLKKAASRAVSAGTFNPYIIDPGQPQQYWDVSYLAVGVEVYYNVWEKEATVKEGGFAFSSRESLKTGDPELFQLIEEIFPENLYQ